MVMLETKEIVEVDDLPEFMAKFKAYDEYKRFYGKDFADWNFDESDYDVMETILQNRSGTYHIETIWRDQQQDDCYFKIYIIERDIEDKVC